MPRPEGRALASDSSPPNPGAHSTTWWSGLAIWSHSTIRDQLGHRIEGPQATAALLVTPIQVTLVSPHPGRCTWHCPGTRPALTIPSLCSMQAVGGILKTYPPGGVPCHVLDPRGRELPPLACDKDSGSGKSPLLPKVPPSLSHLVPRPALSRKVSF